jgi:hypothetical protein
MTTHDASVIDTRTKGKMMNWISELNAIKQRVDESRRAKDEAQAAENRQKERQLRAERIHNLCLLLKWLGVPTDGVPTTYDHWQGDGEPPVEFLPDYVVVDGYKFRGVVLYREYVSTKSTQLKYYLRFEVRVSKVCDFPEPQSIYKPIDIQAPRNLSYKLHTDDHEIDFSDTDVRLSFQAKLAGYLQSLDTEFVAYAEAVAAWDGYVEYRINEYAEEKAARETLAEQERQEREQERLEHLRAIEEAEAKRLQYRAEIAAAIGISPEAFAYLVEAIVEEIEERRGDDHVNRDDFPL